MNYKEILEILKEKLNSVEDLAYDDFDETELGLGPVEEVYQYGGEGEGERWYSVKHFQDHDVYIRIDAYYSSYEGCDFQGWESCEEVRPKEKTITVYESL